MKILYLAWLGSNNLGDVYMWDIFRELGRKYLDPTRCELIPSMPDIDLTHLHPYNLIVLGGGSIIHPKYIRILYQAIQLKKKVMIWGSGIDSLKKEYLIRYQSRSHFDPDEFPENIRSKLATVVKQSVYTGVRGPLTYYLLQNMKLPVERVEQSLDPGLLVEPVFPTSLPPKKVLKGKWIGINWGTSYNKIFGGSELQVEDRLVKVIRKLIKRGYRIYLYLVWWRDQKPALRLYRKIGDHRHVVFDQNIYNHRELLPIIKQCDFTINFKLHANVLSAVAHVPFVALGYRMKVFDFALSMGLEEFVLSTDDDRLADKIELRIVKQKPYYQKTLQTQMKKHLPIAFQKLTKPFRLLQSLQ